MWLIEAGTVSASSVTSFATGQGVQNCGGQGFREELCLDSTRGDNRLKTTVKAGGLQGKMPAEVQGAQHQAVI
jgi:hypothetical protein